MQENDYLQETNHKLLKLCTYLFAALVVLFITTVVTVSITVSRPQMNRFFLVDDNGRVVVEMSPLVNPSQSTAKARTVMDECMRQVFNVDFVHYRQQLLAAEPCFTRNGFSSIAKLFRENGIIKQITVDANVASLTPLDAPFIVNHERLQGVYTGAIAALFCYFGRVTSRSSVSSGFSHTRY